MYKDKYLKYKKKYLDAKNLNSQTGAGDMYGQHGDVYSKYVEEEKKRNTHVYNKLKELKEDKKKYIISEIEKQISVNYYDMPISLTFYYDNENKYESNKKCLHQGTYSINKLKIINDIICKYRINDIISKKNLPKDKIDLLIKINNFDCKNSTEYELKSLTKDELDLLIKLKCGSFINYKCKDKDCTNISNSYKLEDYGYSIYNKILNFFPEEQPNIENNQKIILYKYNEIINDFNEYIYNKFNEPFNNSLDLNTNFNEYFKNKKYELIFNHLYELKDLNLLIDKINPNPNTNIKSTLNTDIKSIFESIKILADKKFDTDINLCKQKVEEEEKRIAAKSNKTDEVNKFKNKEHTK